MRSLSIITTVYNRADFLPSLLRRIDELRQHIPFEYILVDDHSTDASWSLICDFSAQRKWVRRHRNECNLGDYPNRNQAVELVKTTHFTFVDSDDLPSISGYEALHADLLNHDFDYAICSEKIPFKHQEYTFSLLRFHFLVQPIFCFGPGALVHKTSFFHACGGFVTRYGPAADNHYNLKMLSLVRPFLLQYDLVKWQHHALQESQKKNAYSQLNRAVLDATRGSNLPLWIKLKVILAALRKKL